MMKIDTFIEKFGKDKVEVALSLYDKSLKRRKEYAKTRGDKAKGLTAMIEAARANPNGTEAAVLKQFGVAY